MRRNIKVIEPERGRKGYRSAYQEVAVSVRNLLQCDYALVALPDRDSIRVQGFAGREGETSANVAAELIARLRDWGPIVVDDARLIAAPVSSNGRTLGVLIGYSEQPGTFTAGDLEKLMKYTPIAEAMLRNAAPDAPEKTFGADELLHVSGLITMGQLSASFAHEVATPLTLIRGHLRFVDESLPPGHPLRADVEAIDRSARRIEDLAKRMLSFSKKKSRRVERCEVPDVVAEALDLVQPYFRTNCIDVQLQLEPGLPAIRANHGQLVQLMVNLLQNAADAMADAETRVLNVKAQSGVSRVRLVVADTGTGIAAEHLQKIFDPFFTTKGTRGTGLGLYITKQIIEEHRGSVSVQTGDRGTTFVISLPL